MMLKNRNPQQDGKTIQDETQMLLILNCSFLFSSLEVCIQGSKGNKNCINNL